MSIPDLKVLRNPWIRSLGLLALAMISYTVFLVIPPPLSTTRIFPYFSIPIAILLVIFFGALWQQKGYFWECIGIVAVMALFSFSLSFKWQTSLYDGNLIGGLLPWSDASGYFSCANQLLYSGEINIWCARRPLFSLLMAVLFRLTNINLQVSLAILVAINALAVFLAAQEIRRAVQPLSAAVFVILGFYFYSTYAGKVLTENLGFALGALAMAFLVRGIRLTSEKLVLGGVFLLALALNARAGAMFILPCLVLWFTLHFRHKRPVWLLSVAGLGVVGVAFALNLMMVKSFSQAGGVPFSNYAHTFYGLAAGNRGWTQIMADHPAAPEADYPRLALEKFRENPAMLLKGIAGAYQDYFRPSFGAFSFLISTSAKNMFFWLVTGLALLMAFVRRGNGLYGLALAGFAGILFSVGLVPPIDAGMRAYTATIPMSNYVTALGVAGLFSFWRKTTPDETEQKLNEASLLTPFAVLLCFSLLAGPFLVQSSLAPLKPATLAAGCAAGQSKLSLLTGKNSTIYVGNFSQTYTPMVNAADFADAIKGNPGEYPRLDALLGKLETGDQLSVGYDPNKVSTAFLVSTKQPVTDGMAIYCVSPAQDEWLFKNYFFYVNKSAENKDHYIQSDIAFTWIQNHPSVVKLKYVYLVAFVFVLVVLTVKLIGVKQPSLITYLSIIAAILLLVQGVFMNLYTTGKLFAPFGRQRILLDARQAVPEHGNPFLLDLGTTWMNQSELGASPAVVLENGSPLSLPDVERQKIRDKGYGRYLVWNGTLYFSSSDNTDPRTNGRDYEIEWPRPIPLVWQWVSYVLAVAGGSELIVIRLYGSGIVSQVRPVSTKIAGIFKGKMA